MAGQIARRALLATMVSKTGKKRASIAVVQIVQHVQLVMMAFKTGKKRVLTAVVRIVFHARKIMKEKKLALVVTTLKMVGITGQVEA